MDPPILYINLKEAVQRRRSVAAAIAHEFPAGHVVRIEATRGSESAHASYVTPYAEYLLQQRDKVTDSLQMEGWGAVGAYLSHLECWRWLLEQPPTITSALILEDDVCFRPGFRNTWETVVRPLLLPGEDDDDDDGKDPSWDIILLGFMAIERPVSRRIARMPMRSLGRGGYFCGMHAYLLHRRGAEALVATALPMDIQVDGYVLILQQLGRLRLYMIDSEDEVVWRLLGASRSPHGGPGNAKPMHRGYRGEHSPPRSGPLSLSKTPRKMYIGARRTLRSSPVRTPSVPEMEATHRCMHSGPFGGHRHAYHRCHRDAAPAFTTGGERARMRIAGGRPVIFFNVVWFQQMKL